MISQSLMSLNRMKQNTCANTLCAGTLILGASMQKGCFVLVHLCFFLFCDLHLSFCFQGCLNQNYLPKGHLQSWSQLTKDIYRFLTSVSFRSVFFTSLFSVGKLQIPWLLLVLWDSAKALDLWTSRQMFVAMIALKTLDTIGNCQRPVFSTYYMHKIINKSVKI